MLRTLGVIWLSAAAPCVGQVVDVTVRIAQTREPAAGAIVRLLSSTGVAAQGLSSTSGRILLPAPAPGTFRVKVDRIGADGAISAPFDLAAGQTVAMTLEITSRVNALPPIVVTGKSSCGRSDSGEITGIVWEEIGKALTANVITQRSSLPLHVQEFTREVTRAGTIARQWFTRSAVSRGQPFASLPAEALAAGGFVLEEGDSTLYAVPDAALLLSESFVRSHCFGVTTDSSGRVGLRFEPARGRKVPDIRGTIWIDRANAELKFLEFVYLGLPEGLASAKPGGRVAFARLPSGAWIVSSWHTRMPRVLTIPARPPRTPRDSLLGYLEVGGTAEVAVNPAGRIDRAAITGVVFDSIAGLGLAGAVVTLVGSSDTLRTGADGEFALFVEASGDRLLSVYHPRLALLSAPPRLPVLLSIGDTVRIALAVPSLATLTRSLCRSSRPRGVLLGMTLSSNGTPMASLDLRVRWLTTSGYREERARSGSRGGFAFCDLIPGPELPVEVFEGRRPLLQDRVTLEPGKVMWRELVIPEGAQ